MEEKLCRMAVDQHTTAHAVSQFIPGLSRKKIMRALNFVVWMMVILLLLSACSDSQQTAQPAAMEQVVGVKIAQPLNQITTEWDEYTGRVEAVSSVDVRARVGGYLEKVNFTAGEKVKKGDLLFLIDQKPYIAQLNFAKAELDRAKAKHELAKNDLQRATNLFK